MLNPHCLLCLVLRIVLALKWYCCKVCNLAMWVISLLENAKHEARPTQVALRSQFALVSLLWLPFRWRGWWSYSRPWRVWSSRKSFQLRLARSLLLLSGLSSRIWHFHLPCCTGGHLLFSLSLGLSFQDQRVVVDYNSSVCSRFHSSVCLYEIWKKSFRLRQSNVDFL